jgi:hypothetical protein
MEQTIDGTKYIIIPIPPSHAVYASLYGIRTKEQPKSLDEANQISQDIEGAVAKLFEECVKPTPQKEHYTQVLKALFDLTAQVQKDAGLFRKDTKSNRKKSNTISSTGSQAPKRDPGA